MPQDWAAVKKGFIRCMGKDETPQHSSNHRKFCRWIWKLGLNTWSQLWGSDSSSPGTAGQALHFHCSPSLFAVTSGGKIISAEGERLYWESLKMKTNLGNLSSIFGQGRTQMNSFQNWQNESEPEESKCC